MTSESAASQANASAFAVWKPRVPLHARLMQGIVRKSLLLYGAGLGASLYYLHKRRHRKAIAIQVVNISWLAALALVSKKQARERLEPLLQDYLDQIDLGIDQVKQLDSIPDEELPALADLTLSLLDARAQGNVAKSIRAAGYESPLGAGRELALSYTSGRASHLSFGKLKQSVIDANATDQLRESLKLYAPSLIEELQELRPAIDSCSWDPAEDKERQHLQRMRFGIVTLIACGCGLFILKKQGLLRLPRWRRY